MLRYRSSLAYNQLLIAHIELKIVSVKFLPSVRPKNVPRLKMLGTYWNLTHVLFRISWYWFGCQKLFSLNTYHLFGPNWSQNEKMLRIYWNLTELIFQICQSQFWCENWFLWNIYHLLDLNWSRNRSFQNLLTFDTFNISIAMISI